MEKKYIDGFNRVHFISGIIRLNMYTLKGQSEGEPIQEDAGELLLSPQGFVESLNAMQQLADRLTEAGILQRDDQR
ncbi:MAG: hypothetical protein IJU79_01920 [Desulfovibrionaceae bacterium]|nr:hypothetical protein [Desulfovibrionaceae bacterium]